MSLSDISQQRQNIARGQFDCSWYPATIEDRWLSDHPKTIVLPSKPCFIYHVSPQSSSCCLHILNCYATAKIKNKILTSASQ